MAIMLLQSNFVCAESELLRVPVSSQDGGFQDKFEKLCEAEAIIEDIISSLKKKGKIPQDASLIKAIKIACAYGLLSGMYSRDMLTKMLLVNCNPIRKLREAKQWKLPWSYRRKLPKMIKEINDNLKSVFPDIEKITLDSIRFPKLHYIREEEVVGGTIDFFFNSMYVLAKKIGVHSKLNWVSLKSLIAAITHEHLHLTLPGFIDGILGEGVTEYFSSKVLNEEPSGAMSRQVYIVRRLIDIVGEDLVKEAYQTGNILLLEEPLGKARFRKMIEIIRPTICLNIKEYREKNIKKMEALEKLLEIKQGDSSTLTEENLVVTKRLAIQIKKNFDKKEIKLRNLFKKVLSPLKKGDITVNRVKKLFEPHEEKIFDLVIQLREILIEIVILSSDTNSYVSLKRFEDISSVSGMCIAIGDCLEKALKGIGLSSTPEHILGPEDIVEFKSLKVHSYHNIEGNEGTISIDVISGQFIPGNRGRVVVALFSDYKKQIEQAVRLRFEEENILAKEKDLTKQFEIVNNRSGSMLWEVVARLSYLKRISKSAIRTETLEMLQSVKKLSLNL